MKFVKIVLVATLSMAFAACLVQRAENVTPETSESSPPDPVAARQPVLVELFTSEGCSSCPPADRQLAFLENSQPVAGADIITLAFHVDYWNRLGWTDKYSSPQFSERQNSYVQLMGLDSSYTPQMVVDGQLQFVGSDGGRAGEAIAKAAAAAKSAVGVTIGTNNVEISIPEIKVDGSAKVFLAVAEDGIVTEVKSGENGGRKLPHISIVRKLEVVGRVGESESSFKATVKLPSDPGWKTENLKYVVFVQEDGIGKVVAVGKASPLRPQKSA